MTVTVYAEWLKLKQWLYHQYEITQLTLSFTDNRNYT